MLLQWTFYGSTCQYNAEYSVTDKHGSPQIWHRDGLNLKTKMFCVEMFFFKCISGFTFRLINVSFFNFPAIKTKWGSVKDD